MRVINLERKRLDERSGYIFWAPNIPDSFKGGGKVVPLEDVLILQRRARAMAVHQRDGHSLQCVCDKCRLADSVLACL